MSAQIQLFKVAQTLDNLFEVSVFQATVPCLLKILSGFLGEF